MSKKLNCIMLIDDDEDDNFFHEIAISTNNFADTVIVQDSGIKALEHIRANTPPDSDLIFLDINMPRMTGWDFLVEYNKLEKTLQKRPIIAMLSTSFNKNDILKAKESALVSDYIVKPLTKEILETIIEKHFK